MKLGTAILLPVVLAMSPAVEPAQASSVSAVMYGPWALACPRSMARDRRLSCMIHYQPPGEDITWSVSLDADSSRFSTRGWSRTLCRQISVAQDGRRPYRFSDDVIRRWEMEEHAHLLLEAMRSHIPFFGDCTREEGNSHAYPETLLDGLEADFTRALIAAETNLRGRGPDPNDGSTNPANISYIEFKGPPEGLDRIAQIGRELDWYVDGHTQRRVALLPPPNYDTTKFNILLERIRSLGLTDIDIRLMGRYGPARLER